VSKHKQNRLIAITCVALGLFITDIDAIENLRSKAQLLHCSSSQEEALTHIQSISSAPLFKPGLPNETADLTNPGLKAETLSQLLSVLHASAIKFPQNKDKVESILLQWNFCGVVDRGTYFDHRIHAGKAIRTESSGSANNWQGFKLFGIVPGCVLPSSGTTAFQFTTHHQENVSSMLADSYLLQSHIKQCLPHPDDLRLYRTNTKNFISRIIPISPINKNIAEDNWVTHCKPLNVTATEPTRNTLQTNIVSEKPDTATLTPITTAEPELGAAITSHTQSSSTAQKTTKLKRQTKKPPSQKPSKVVSIPDAGIIVPFEPLESSPPNTVVTSNLPPVPVITSATSGNAITSTNVIRSHGLSGALSLENRSFDSDLTSIKLSASYKPLSDSYWFIRTAINASQTDKPAYSWGLGYDDWHAGSWGFQINHWGPLELGDGLEVKNSTMALNYKFDTSWLAKRNIASSVELSKTFSGKPSVSWGWSWNPRSHFFVRSTMIYPTDTQDINWSYGLRKTDS